MNIKAFIEKLQRFMVDFDAQDLPVYISTEYGEEFSVVSVSVRMRGGKWDSAIVNVIERSEDEGGS